MLIYFACRWIYIQDKEDEVELKTDPEEYEATLAAGVANSTISDNRTNPSFFPTQGFLRKVTYSYKMNCE